MKTPKTWKALFIFMSMVWALQSWADVPQVDAVTRKVQAEFAAGTLPTMKDLTLKYKWTCGDFSTIPNETDVVLDASFATFNSFNGVITSSILFKGYTSPDTRAWAESSDGKNLEYMSSFNAYTDYAGNTAHFVATRRFFDTRVYKGHLIIEVSVEVLPEMPALYQQPLALYSHAISNPDRAVLFYTVCP